MDRKDSVKIFIEYIQISKFLLNTAKNKLLQNISKCL